MIVLGLSVSVVILAALFFMARKKVGFGVRVFTAMAGGALVGILFKEFAPNAAILGQIFLNLIRMLVIPLVFSSIITSLSSVESLGKLRKIGFKTVALFLATTAAATVIGIVSARIFDVGRGLAFAADASFQPREIPPFTQVLLDFIPSNPIAQAADGRLIPLIVFAFIIGIAIVVEREKHAEAVEPVRNFFAGFTRIMFRITRFVLRFTPYGVFGLIASVAARYGAESLLPLWSVILAVYAGLAFHAVAVYGGLLTFWARVNPIRFFRKSLPAQVVAFSTRSSYGTLPITLRTVKERLGVSERIANFAAPLGASIHFDGCGGVYPAVVAIFVARLFGIELTAVQYLLLVFTTVVSSFGIAGVPGPASIATTVVLTTLGLPLEGFALVLGIDALLDMGRTWLNVTGDMVVAVTVAQSEGELDRAVLESAEETPIGFESPA
jgi:Na+/H+-dicarboxylate symporter